MVRRRIYARMASAGIGIALDRLVGEPPSAYHPVAHFGRLTAAVEVRLWRDTKPAGISLIAIAVGVGAAVGSVANRLVRPLPGAWGSNLATVMATTTAVAGLALEEAAVGVADALDRGDLNVARMLLPALVGRDPSDLDESEIARAVIESVAENTVDAVVAPTLWAAVGGAVGALVYRAVNTLDAMVGHRNERYRNFGWASARADDAANWVPARITAVLVGVLRPGALPAIRRGVKQDAAAHPSPNAGVAEAAFGAALGVELGGISRYGDRVEDRGRLGDGRAPEPSDIRKALELARQVDFLLAGMLVVPWIVSRLAGQGPILGSNRTGVQSNQTRGQSNQAGLR